MSDKPVNLLLLLVAVVLSVIIFPAAIVYTLTLALLQAKPGKIIGYLSQFALSMSLSIDQLGNTICRDLLNKCLRKPGGYDFGNYQETISRVLGKNKALGTLTSPGRGLSNLLNSIDRDHVERAAQG